MVRGTVTNTTPRAIIAACGNMGITGAQLLRESGLEGESVTSKTGRTEFPKVVKLWEQARRLTGKDTIGIDAALTQSFGTFKLLDFLIPVSETPQEGLKRLLDFYPLINESFVLTSSVSDGIPFIEMHCPDDFEGLVPEYVDYVFACIIDRFRMSSGTHRFVKRLELVRNEPTDPERYFCHYETNVKFGSKVNRIGFDPGFLKLSQPNADPMVCALLDRQVDRILNQEPEAEFLKSVRRVMLRDIRSGSPNLASTARSMRISKRTLQRRLHASGVSYRKIRNEVREMFARDLLLNGDLSIEQTAFTLGYHDKSSFHRAFKLWTGVSPGEFRKGSCSN